MSSSEEKYIKIAAVLKAYLRDNYLPKIAYLSNCLPNDLEGRYLIQDFNYICFCVTNHFQMSQVLFLRHFLGYRKIPFDVKICTIEAGVYSRQFSYICLDGDSKQWASSMIDYVCINKRNINRRYDVLLRVTCNKEKLDDIKLPVNSIIVDRSTSGNDIILRIKQ